MTASSTKPGQGRLKRLGADLDKPTRKALEAEFGKPTEDGKPPVDMTESLATWRKIFQDVNLLKNNQEKSLRKTVAEIAFGLRKYKEAVDSVLTKPGLDKVRMDYYATLDGFGKQIHKQIDQCRKILGGSGG